MDNYFNKVGGREEKRLVLEARRRAEKKVTEKLDEDEK